MRTSKISRETAKVVNAAPVMSSRSTRSSLSRLAHRVSVKEEQHQVRGRKTPTDIEDVIPSTRKRKRESTPRTPIKRSPGKSVAIKTEAEEIVKFSSIRERKVRKPARKINNEVTGDVEILPPNDWAEVYAVVKEMRTIGLAQHAAVDTMGCEKLAEAGVSPRVKRFHTLIALMLSSQTKDTTNAVAMSQLRQQLPPYKEGAPSGLNLENILAVEPKLLNELIWVVGFHNNKTKYIKAAAEILRDKWGSDIPDTIEGLMSLPGVGPKMAYLCMSTAWGRTEGIGVDVHVHRITNLWGWHQTKTPEETRLALEAWLPRELWHEINWLLVGFGQKICLPAGRKCGDCELGLRGLCKAADRSKVMRGRKMRDNHNDDQAKAEIEAPRIMEKLTAKGADQPDAEPEADSTAEVKVEAMVKAEENETSPVIYQASQ